MLIKNLYQVYMSEINKVIILEPVQSDTPRSQGNVSDCTGCRNTQLLYQLTEILWDHEFLSDVTGCWKAQVSDCTSSFIFV